MAFRPAKCLSCTKEIQVPDDQDVAICMYCGGSIIVRDAVQITVGANLENLLAMARNATAAGNHLEAYTYFNRVLEIDPQNSDAWIGKGSSAGWMSNLKEFRFPEVILAFENAIRFVTQASQQEATRLCAHSITTIGAACYTMARAHVYKFVSVPNVWIEYLAQSRQIINFIEIGLRFEPNDIQAVKNIILICKENIQGIKFRDPVGNVARAVFLVASYETEIRSILDRHESRLLELEPEYRKTEVVAHKPDPCFVVTATMGNEMHPCVILLRDFRDTVLIKSVKGKRFITWYYRNGPILAKIVAKNKLLRFISLITVVIPAFVVARVIMNRALDRQRNK